MPGINNAVRTAPLLKAHTTSQPNQRCQRSKFPTRDNFAVADPQNQLLSRHFIYYNIFLFNLQAESKVARFDAHKAVGANITKFHRVLINLLAFATDHAYVRNGTRKGDGSVLDAVDRAIEICHSNTIFILIAAAIQVRMSRAYGRQLLTAKPRNDFTKLCATAIIPIDAAILALRLGTKAEHKETFLARVLIYRKKWRVGVRSRNSW